jgi:hypothetical protein
MPYRSLLGFFWDVPSCRIFIGEIFRYTSCPHLTQLRVHSIPDGGGLDRVEHRGAELKFHCCAPPHDTPTPRHPAPPDALCSHFSHSHARKRAAGNPISHHLMNDLCLLVASDFVVSGWWWKHAPSPRLTCISTHCKAT